MGWWPHSGPCRGTEASLMLALCAHSVPLPGGLHRDQVLRQQVRALGCGRHRPDAARVML